MSRPPSQKRPRRLSTLLSYLLTLVLALAAIDLAWRTDALPLDSARYIRSGAGLLEGFFESLDDEQVASSSDKTVTVLVYMNGSDLETELGSATDDLTEMVKAGSSSQVNVVVQTMGTLSWEPKYGIASDHAQIYEVGGTGLTLVRDGLDNVDCTSSQTLEDFIAWGAQAYPADRYILLMWDHGGGPVYGFGYDEHNENPYAALTLDEMDAALDACGVHFDLIGFDACIMASLEVCAVLADHCDYAVLSEDFEPSIGWFYTDWIRALYEDTSLSGAQLGALIADSTVVACQDDPVFGGETILTVFDERKVGSLFDAWTAFAYANTEDLLATNYSIELVAQGRVIPALASDVARPLDWSLQTWQDGVQGDDEEDEGEGQQDGYEELETLSDYYCVDILAVAAAVCSPESAVLAAALDDAVVYSNATEADETLCGLSVTLPYGDKLFYREQQKVYSKCGIDPAYIAWLGGFVGARGTGNYFDFGRWAPSWGGWDAPDFGVFGEADGEGPASAPTQPPASLAELFAASF